MCSVRFTISTHDRNAVERPLKTARPLGRLRQAHSRRAILAVMDGQSVAEVAVVLRGHAKTVAAWVRLLCCDGLPGAPRQKPPGRPPTLPPTPKEALAQRIAEGPVRAGFSAACWCSPMLQQVIDDRVGVFSNVFSMAQLLKNLGLSSQQAAFVADQLDVVKRTTWCTTTGPPMLRLAQEGKALLLCGDDVSFPQWGTLT